MRTKAMMVNGVHYPSIREAARFIAAEAGKVENTIVKELRSLWSDRLPWNMYGRFWVEKV